MQFAAFYGNENASRKRVGIPFGVFSKVKQRRGRKKTEMVTLKDGRIRGSYRVELFVWRI